MSSISNLFLQNNPYEKFVQQLVQIESRTKLQLQNQKSVQNEKKTALGQVSSSISKFISKIDELQKPNNKSFQPLSGTSSNRDTVRITSTDGIKKPANYNITIDRLAKNDIVLSNVMDGNGSELSVFGNGSVEITIGEKTETISVETTYEDDNGDIQQKSNSEILTSFADKIDEQFGDVARANRFNISGDNVQFSMQSLDTGFDNRIQFSNATGVLDEIVSNTTRSTPEEDLNARFTIDGVEFERGSNSIDDAIEGLSFTLVKATGEQEQLSVTRDVSKARTNINGFIAAFNEMNTTIRDRTFLDSANNRRGALQDIRAIRNLTINLRQTGLQGMDAAEGDISRLSEMGISFRNDGSMFVDDAELLTEALTDRAEEVTRFFADEDSIISQMKLQAEAYTKRDSGILTSIESGLDQKIDRLDNRITAQNRYLERYEEQQRAIFNQLQAVIDRGDAQFAQVMNFRNRMGF